MNFTIFYQSSCHHFTKREINWIIKRLKLITVWKWCDRTNKQTIERTNERTSERASKRVGKQTNEWNMYQIYRTNVNEWEIKQQPLSYVIVSQMERNETNRNGTLSNTNNMYVCIYISHGARKCDYWICNCR